MKLLILVCLVLGVSNGFAGSLEEKVMTLEQKVLKLEGKGLGKYYANKIGAKSYTVGNECSEIKPSRYQGRIDSWKMRAIKELNCGQITYVFTQIEDSWIEVYDKTDLVELSN